MPQDHTHPDETGQTRKPIAVAVSAASAICAAICAVAVTLGGQYREWAVDVVALAVCLHCVQAYTVKAVRLWKVSRP